MSGSSSVLAWSSALEDFALFRTLSAEQRLKTLNAMVRQDLVRGQMLVAQGGPSDSLFLVLHGALAVRKTGYLEPIAELRAGELVGEIGFFADVPRTADVIAIRDTSVLALTRPAYQEARRGSPRHRRGAARSAGAAIRQGDRPHRAVSLVAEGAHHSADRRWIGAACRALSIAGYARGWPRPMPRLSMPPVSTRCFPGARSMPTKSPNGSTSSNTPLRWWSISAAATPRHGRAKAVRQADMVVFALPWGCACRSIDRNRGLRLRGSFRLGQDAWSVFMTSECGEVSGTAAWLARLPAFMHHHVALEDQVDIDSLIRFLCGRAVGFVAAGGGSFGTAHVGIYKAISRTRVMFDIFVGTSVGSAMVAGLPKISKPSISSAARTKFRQEQKFPAADLAALCAAGSQGVRSRACLSIWP